MLKLVAIVFAFCALTYQSAEAQAVGNGGPSVILPMTTTPASCSYKALTGTGTTLIVTGAAVFCGIQSFGTQLGITSCFDSTNGTGQMIGGGVTLGIAGTSGPPSSLGINVVNGISCTQTISLLGGGILAYYR